MVDEIVVCDDGSTDRTIEIIKTFSNVNNDVDIRIFVNKRNIGVSANFQKAIDLCKGDIIFLSDQDDVWYPHKVKTIVEWFTNNPQKTVVFTNADLIDDKGKIMTNDSLFDRVGFGLFFRDYFDKGCELPVFYCNHATGATMAIKNKISFAKYCSSEILHDEVIALMSLQNSQLGYILEPLIQYRFHGNQEMSIPKDMNAAMKRFNKKHLLNPEINGSRTYRWKFPLNSCSMLYIEWLKKRAKNNRIIMGCILPIFHIRKYREQYDSKCLSFMCYDMKSSLKHILLCFRKLIILEEK